MAIDNNIPTFVERDPAVIMAESKAKLEELLGRELQPAQVEQLILNFVVFRETLLVNRFNAGMRQMLYQFSTAPILDYIAGWWPSSVCRRPVLGVPSASLLLQGTAPF